MKSKLNAVNLGINGKATKEGEEHAQQQQIKTDNKIQGFLRTISNLQQTTRKLQLQVRYCQQVKQWLHSLLTSKDKPLENGLKSLLSSSAKLNILEKQAIFSLNKGNEKEKQDGKQKQTKNSCSISEHLSYILKPNSSRKDKIGQLQEKRQSLYSKIEEILAREQPYLHQKIMKKVKKEVKRQKKMQAIKQLQHFCKSKQNWLNQAQQQIQREIDEKVIQQKLTNNLTKMKEIMNKKVINNDYIFQILNNKLTVDKNKDKLKRSLQQAKDILKEQMAKMKDQHLDEELSQIQQQKEAKLNYVEFDETFMAELGQIMHQGERILGMPLSSSVTQNLIQESERLGERINNLLNIKH